MLPSGVAIAHPGRLYIGGAWVQPHSDREIEIVSPDSEQVVARVAEADEADMDAAVAAAREAFDSGPWPHLSKAARLALFRKLVDHLRARTDELALCWNAQVGGLMSFAPIMHTGAVMTLDQIAGFAEAFAFTEVRPSTGAPTGIVAHEPVGVVAAIAPWNAPFGIMANKVAYPLVTGCTVVMKPSPETPLEAYIIAEAAEAAGLPPGVVNLVTGQREASDHLVCNPGIDKVSFTGSTLAGKLRTWVTSQ
jgi:aldehyde dehydrogenase (NAD+)